jgi:hypothetical protein
LSEAGFLPGLTLASCAAAGGDIFSLLMGLAISSVRSLFMGRLKIPPKDLCVVDPSDPFMPKRPLERPIIFAIGCLSARRKADLAVSAVLGETGELVGPVNWLMPLVVRLGGLACRASGKLAVGVFCALSGDGVFLLKKLLSGEVLPVLICPLEVGAADVTPTPTPVAVVF